MRYPKEIITLANDSGFTTAREILKSVISGKIPSIDLLRRLYPGDLALIIQRDIELYTRETRNPDRKPREHQVNAPTDISDARSVAEISPTYQAVHSRILIGEIPEINELENIYGEYADFAHTVFRNFKRYKLFRKCGLPSAAHVNRVGAVSTIIDINDPGSRLYSAIAVGHDFIEDLLYKAVDEDGVHYSFKRYTEFVEKFIPEELRQGILILTNHYDIVVRHIAEYLDNYNLGLNKNSVYDSVKELLSEKGNDGVINGYLNSDDELPQSNIPSSIQEYAQKTLDLILDLPADKMKFEDIRWACYTELYLKDLAALSKKADNFRFFEIKSFDLSDNGHGIGSLSMDARIRNLLKQEAWAREGYQFNTEWAPINKRIMELNEDILVFAEYFVIKDLLELQSLQDFLISALYKIRRLDKIFYTD